MKTLAVLSDTHGNVKDIQKILPIMQSCDYVVHLGDCMRDMYPFKEVLGTRLIQVKGNCDHEAGIKTAELEVEGKKLFFTHGDLFGVKSSMLSLSLYAKENSFDGVFFGHTHYCHLSQDGGIVYCNPGAMERLELEKSFAFVTVTKEKILCKINRSAVR